MVAGFVPTSQRLVLAIIFWIFILHASGLYLFTRGFLLSRLSLDKVNDCDLAACTLPPTHKHAVFLIIDALRFDFVSPDPPNPPSPFHHNVLTLPAELTKARPRHSFIFNAFSDPPTTTLQRIKGITTGSLPTFIDMGSNFGGSAVTEDSLISQLQRNGRKIAFMGDDTWMSAFPDTFNSNMSFPYDSFNVEDLHTVDEGVIAHLFPLLQDKSTQWDFIIGHFLGVDHVGHRTGPDQPTMKAKLKQMDDVLRKVVALLEDDTLLVVIGDHGMDRKGDHGGDGIHETSAATWIYSKSTPLMDNKRTPPSLLTPTTLFPDTTIPHRRIQQIDLVPTLSLLLGLPIPFNNLGSVVPELFLRGSQLEQAVSLNALQIHAYLQAYRDSSSGGELDLAWSDLSEAWAAAQSTPTVSQYSYARLALETCRSLWAQFNVVLIVFGLLTLVLALAAGVAFYVAVGSQAVEWEVWARPTFERAISMGCIGAIGGFVLYLPLQFFIAPYISLTQTVLLCFSISSSLQPIIASTSFSFPKISIPTLLPVILHTLAFMSNSFTVWEDKLITVLLVSSIGPALLSAFSAPIPRLRNRLLFFSVVFAVCVRLMAMSTVCREEQQPYCSVTFYASSSLPSPPLLVLLLSIPTSIFLPTALRRFLQISKSDEGVAPMFLEWFMRCALVCGNLCWMLEWIEGANYAGDDWAWSLRLARTAIARLSIGGTVLGGFSLWWLAPLCLRISSKTVAGKREVTVVGFANSYGASYLLFTTLFFSVISISSQLTGQITLALAFVALLAYVEIVDSQRDVAPQATRMPTFREVTPLALLALHTFYATGHQSTLPSLQWKTAFLLTTTLTYPISPLLVILNTFGPQMFVAIAAILLALWAVSPLPQPRQNQSVAAHTLRVALSFIGFFCTLLVGSALGAAWLRRHLMVWKIFAPRFMTAGAGLLAVDVALLLAVAVGTERVSQNVRGAFGKKE